MLKVCDVCKEEFEGHHSSRRCSDKCKKAYKKAYKKDYMKAYKKDYQQSEKYKAYQKAYSQSDKRKAYRKAYRQSEKEKAYQKAYSKTPAGKYTAYKRGAKKRGKKFELTFQEFMTFWQLPCFYCGDPIDTIGLDRIDNSIGYREDNVVSCCTSCNTAKMSLSQTDFFIKIEKIYLKHLAEK